MAAPLLFKVFLVAVYTLALLIPFTSQFFLPATPIFSWLLLFYSSQFIPKSYRPHIWVSVLPTLESVLYGANISDLLTRWTTPFLDIMAWLPYGVAHFVIPFVVAALLFIFSPPGAVKFFGAAFGYMNLVGVMIQIAFPCAPPCKFSSLLFVAIQVTHSLDARRVRTSRRTRSSQLQHARFSWRTRSNRRHLRRSRLRQDFLGGSRTFWGLPLPSRWMFDDGSTLLESFLPERQSFLLDLRFLALLEYYGESSLQL